MPFYYSGNSGQNTLADIVTSATPNTELDQAFVSVGTGANVEFATALTFICGGKGAGLPTISGIAIRIKKWVSTASSGGNAALNSDDPGNQGIAGAQLSAAFASAGVAITSGTGGPTFLGGFVMGATGPGGWWTNDLRSMITEVGSGAAQSIDLFSSSGTASLPYEASIMVSARR